MLVLPYSRLAILWTVIQQIAAPILLAFFWPLRISLISQVQNYDGSDESSLALTVFSCLQFLLVWAARISASFPLHGLMTSRYRGEVRSPLALRGVGLADCHDLLFIDRVAPVDCLSAHQQVS